MKRAEEVRNGGDNSALMIKDGVLYCFVFGSRVYSIALDMFAQDARALPRPSFRSAAVTDEERIRQGLRIGTNRRADMPFSTIRTDCICSENRAKRYVTE